MNPDTTHNSTLSPELDAATAARIDAALSQLGSVAPRAGLEGRIAAHLASANVYVSTQASWFSLRRLTVLSVAGLAIVAGSVMHSKQALPMAPGATIARQSTTATHASGLQAADKSIEAPKPVAAPAHGRPRATHKADAGTQQGTIAAPRTVAPAQP